MNVLFIHRLQTIPRIFSSVAHLRNLRILHRIRRRNAVVTYDVLDCSFLLFSSSSSSSFSRSRALSLSLFSLCSPLLSASPLHTYTRLIIRPDASRGWALFIAWQLCVVRGRVNAYSRDRSYKTTVSDARNHASDKRIAARQRTRSLRRLIEDPSRSRPE